MEQSEKHIEELILAYFAGTATEEEIAELTVWVQEKKENRYYYEQLRNVWQVSNPAFSANDINTENAHEKIMRKLSSHSWYSTAYTYWQQAAAVLLLPLIIISAYFYYQTNEGYGDISYQEVTVPYGTYSQINLPDGSVVWLNAGSKLKYPTVFKKGERTVFLSGEAFFEVESDMDNPFIVATDALNVRATGTAFNVEAYKEEPVAVTLVKGMVNVQLAHKVNDVSLKPADRLIYTEKNNSCMIQKTDPYKWYAWKDGNLVFRDDSLAYIMKKIGQCYNVDITIKDPEVGAQPYRVTFENESLPVILELLKLTAPIDYKVYEHTKSSDGRYNKTHIEVYGIKKN